jgi:hypothetical protein
MKKNTAKKSKPAKRSLREILQKPAKKPSMKETPHETPGEKKFKVTLVVTGDMLDKDTPISADALQAFFEMQYASSKALKVNFMEASEIVPEPAAPAQAETVAAPVAVEPPVQ